MPNQIDFVPDVPGQQSAGAIDFQPEPTPSNPLAAYSLASGLTAEPPVIPPPVIPPPVIPPPVMRADEPQGAPPQSFFSPLSSIPSKVLGIESALNLAHLAKRAIQGKPLPPIPEIEDVMAGKYNAGEPLITLPGLTVDQQKDSFVRAASKEIVNAVKSVPEFFTSDLGLISLMAGRFAPRLVSAAFAVDLSKSALEGAKQMYTGWEKMTPAQKGVALVDTLASLAFAGLSGAHALKRPGLPPMERPAGEKFVSPFESVDEAFQAGLRKAPPPIPELAVAPAAEVARGTTLIPQGQIPSQPFVAPEAGPLGVVPPMPAEQAVPSGTVAEGATIIPTATTGVTHANVVERPREEHIGVPPRQEIPPDVTQVRKGEGRPDRGGSGDVGVPPSEAQAEGKPEVIPAPPKPTHTPDQLQPALLVGGIPEIGGDNHSDIRTLLIGKAQTGDPDQIVHRKVVINQAFLDDANHVFVDDKGNPLTRLQAGAALGLFDAEGNPIPLQSPKLNELKREWAAKQQIPPLPTPAETGTVVTPTAGAETTGTVRTVTAGEASQTRSTDVGKATEMTADRGVSPRRTPAVGLTPEDEVLFPLSQIGKLPMLILPRGMMAEYVRLRNKQRKGDLLRTKERERLRIISERLPDNFEDDYGVNGEAMRSAYKAADRAGVAAELFSVVGSAKGFRTDIILDALEAETGKRYNLFELFKKIEGLAREHGERVSGRKAETQTGALETDRLQALRFNRDTIKPTPGTKPLAFDELRVGTQFTLKGTNLRVTEVFTDEDGMVTSVTLDDGKRYGTRNVNNTAQLRHDEGSLKQPAETEPEWITPEVEPPTPPPAAAAEQPPVAGVPGGRAEPAAPVPKPVAPVVDLFGNVIEQPAVPETPTEPVPQQDMLGLEGAAPKKAEVQERPLTPAEQREFRELSLKLRQQREENGPALTTAETQRYEYLGALAGQKTLGIGEGEISLNEKLRLAQRKLADLEGQLEETGYKGKKARALSEQISALTREIELIRSDLTEGRGEVLLKTPISKNPNNGLMESQEFRVRQLTTQEYFELFPNPSERIRLFGNLYEPWIAESRRLYYSDDGKRIENRDPWYRESVEASRQAAIAKAASYDGRTARRWKQILESQNVPKAPEAPVEPPPPPEAPPVIPPPSLDESVKQGDSIRWEPNEYRRTKFGETPVQGIVQDVIRNQEGEIGFNIFTPTKDDPSRVVRVWSGNGKVVSRKPASVEAQLPGVRPAEALREVGTPVRPKSVVEIADEIAAQGVDPQASYGLFVKARDLKPEISASEWLPIYRRSLELANLNKQIEISKRSRVPAEPVIVQYKDKRYRKDPATGRWHLLDAEGNLVGPPANKGLTKNLEAEAARPPAPAETRPNEALLALPRVRVKISNGLTFVRITDERGRKSVASLAELNTGENPFVGVDIRKIEVGVGPREKFSPKEGEISIADLSRERQGALPRPEGIPVDIGGSNFFLIPPDIGMPGRMGFPAHHGTPHEVDRFRTEKIGTGEGAQVYGWGLYFAENRAVSEEYARRLGEGSIGLYDKQQFDPYNPRHQAAVLLEQSGGDRAKAITEAKRVQSEWGASPHRETFARAQEVLRNGTESKITRGGNIYTVDLDVKPEQLLDWDKPINEQLPEVIKLLRPAIDELVAWRKRIGAGQVFGMSHERTVESMSANHFYRELSDRNLHIPGTPFVGTTTGARLASEFLNRLGIKGIRYLDQGSRRPIYEVEESRSHPGLWDITDNNAEGAVFESAWSSYELARQRAEKLNEQAPRTYNYVIFDENVIKITDVNGKPVTMDEARQAMAARQLPQWPSDRVFLPMQKEMEAMPLPQLRVRLQDPNLPIPNEMRAKLDRLLQFPIFDKLPGLKVAITDYVAGGMTGEFLPNQDLIRLMRFSDADVPTHEFMHAIHKFLSPADRRYVAELRRQMLQDEIAKATDPDTKRLLSDLLDFPKTSDEYFSGDHNRNYYHFTNEFEFFAKLMTEKFEQAMARPEARTFVAKIRQFMAELWQSIKDAFGIGNGTYADVLARQLISGKYDIRPEDAMVFRDGRNRRQASAPLAKTLKDVDRLRVYEDIGWRSSLVGGYFHLFETQRRHADALGISEAARARDKMTVHGDLRQIGLDESGKANYYDARDNAASFGEKQEVIINAFESVIRYQGHGIGLRRDLEASQRELESPEFRRRIESAADKRDLADMLKEAKQTYVLQVAGSAGSIAAQMERQRIIGVEHEALGDALRRVQQLPDFTERVAQLADQIVNTVAVDDQGISLLGAGGSRDGADILNRYFELNPDAVHAGPDQHALMQLTTAVLAANRDLRNAMTSLAILSRDTLLQTQVNEVGRRLATEFINNPATAIPRLAKRAANLGDKSARAEAAWLALHRGVQKQLAKHNTLQEAVQLHDATWNDPEWRQYVNDVMRDNDAILYPDDVLERMIAEKESGKEVPEPIRRAFWKMSGQQTIYSPQGNKYDIDFGWTQTTVQKAMEEAGKLSADIAEWLDPMLHPENLNNPSRGFWEERHKEIQATILNAGIWNPNAMQMVLGKGSWGMPEVFFQGLALPQAKQTFLAAKNYDRWWAQAKGWFTKWKDKLQTATRNAYRSHGYSELEVEAFRAAMLDQIGFRFRNGREVRVGDWIAGMQVTKADMEWLHSQGRAFAEAFELNWKTADLSGAGDVMEHPRIVDDFQGGAWGVRRSQERGLLPFTTVPRGFSDHGRALSRAVHQDVVDRNSELEGLPQKIVDLTPEQSEAMRQDIRDAFYLKVSEYLSDPDIFNQYVLESFIGNRTSNIHKTPSPFEQHYRVLQEMMANNHPDLPSSIDGLVLWLGQRLDAEWTERVDSRNLPIKVADQLISEITTQTERFYRDFGRSDLDPQVVMNDPARKTAFTEATKGEIFPAYFYSYGATSVGGLRGYAADMSMFGFSRLMESLRVLRKNISDSISKIQGKPDETGGWTKEQIKNVALKYRNGEDYRDYELLKFKLGELDRFIEGLPIWAGHNIAKVEGLKLGLAQRLLSDTIQAALTGPRTLWRISGAAGGGSAVKMAQVMWQMGYSRWKSYPSSVLSAVESMLRFGTSAAFGWYHPGKGFVPGIPLTLARNIPGAIKAAATAGKGRRVSEFIIRELQDTTDAQFAALSYWNDLKQLGLTPDNLMGNRIANMLAEPITRGGVFNVKQRTGEVGRAIQTISKYGFYGPLATIEAAMEVISSRFPTAGYNITYDAVSRMAAWYADALAGNARKTFENYERLGWLSKFNFDNLQDPKNALAPWEMLPSFWGKIGIRDQRRIPSWLRPSSTNAQLARELFFSSMRYDLQDLILLYWKRLAQTPREQRGAIEFLAPDIIDAAQAAEQAKARMLGLASRFVEQTHHQAPSNRPYQLQKNIGFMSILPFAGWSAQTIKQFAVYWGKVAYPFGRDGAKFDARAGLVAAALVSAIGFAIYSYLGGDAEVRFLRMWDRYVNHKNSQLKTIDEATNPVEASEIALHNISAVMPLMNSALNNLLGATGYRGTYGFQAFAFDKINALLNYARGVVRTGDPTYGIDRLVAAQIPFTETIIENTFNRNGRQLDRNTVRALQKFGPQELVERRASATVSLPTELTPYRAALDQAVFSGRPENVAKAAANFVEKARELGRPDPEKSLAQTFSTLNPYRQAFGGLITDQQRQDALNRMSPWEREQVSKAETAYQAAAKQLGLSSSMTKDESASRADATTGTGVSTVSGVRGVGGGGGGVPGIGPRRVSLGRTRGVRMGGIGRRLGLRGIGRASLGLRGGRRTRLFTGRLSPRSGRIRRLAKAPRRRRVTLA